MYKLGVKMDEVLKKTLPYVIVGLFLFSGLAYAGNLADNALVPLMNGDVKKWSLEVSGMFPQPSEGSTFNRRGLKDDNIAHSFTINVDGSGEPVKSYLYLLVSDYYQPSMTWTVNFNGNILVASEHSDSIGGNIKGDGKVDHERQTIFFDVTGMVSTGENTLAITDVYATQRYYFDGAILLNFYPSNEEHQYWVYHGVEYLENVDRYDANYTQFFESASYPSNSEATLYTIYQNKEQDHDTLYFNDNLLKDKDAVYLLKGSEMIAKTFSVSKYLNSNDKVTFDMERYQTDPGAPFIQYTLNPIYPSLAILDVKLPPKPKVVVLANSIDYGLASDFFGFLENRGMEVIRATADDFDQYKTQKFIVILGGPDAPEGVGDIVRDSGVLDIDDVDYIREKGHKQKFVGHNPWGKLAGQVVWIIAGSDRDQTVEAHKAHRNSVTQDVEAITNPPEIELTPTDPCPPSEDNPITHVFPEKITDVYICEVVYSQKDNWKITFYNQGEEEVDLHRYLLSDKNGRQYRIMGGDDNVEMIASGGYYTIYGTTFNPQGKSTSGIYLGPSLGDVTLQDSAGILLDKVEWGSTSY
jgi:hypothetical protein